MDIPAGYVHTTSTGSTVNDLTSSTDADGVVSITGGTYYTKQLVELKGDRASEQLETFYIKNANAGSDIDILSVAIDGATCGTDAVVAAGAVTTAWDPPTARCGGAIAWNDDKFSVTIRASAGATIRLSESATDEGPSLTGAFFSHAVSNNEATNVTLPTGTRKYYIHVTAGDGYTSNDPRGADASVGGTDADFAFDVRRRADVRLNTLSIRWGGDRIDLSRRDLGLHPGNPDGETGPVLGPVTLSVVLDKGDNGAAVPSDEDLTIVPVGRNTDFDRLYFTGEGLNEDKTGVTAAFLGTTDYAAYIGDAAFGSCPTTTVSDHTDNYGGTSPKTSVIRHLPLLTSTGKAYPDCS